MKLLDFDGEREDGRRIGGKERVIGGGEMSHGKRKLFVLFAFFDRTFPKVDHEFFREYRQKSSGESL